MTDSLPSQNPRRSSDTHIDELAWYSIIYGAALGTIYTLLTLNWLSYTFVSFPDAIRSVLMLIVSALNVSQLPIGIGILQKQRWAAIASYRTMIALILLGLLGLPLCFWAGSTYLVLPLFSAGLGTVRSQHHPVER
jgi:hypothetical protein